VVGVFFFGGGAVYSTVLLGCLDLSFLYCTALEYGTRTALCSKLTLERRNRTCTSSSHCRSFFFSFSKQKERTFITFDHFCFAWIWVVCNMVHSFLFCKETTGKSLQVTGEEEEEVRYCTVRYSSTAGEGRMVMGSTGVFMLLEWDGMGCTIPPKLLKLGLTSGMLLMILLPVHHDDTPPSLPPCPPVS